MYPFGSFCRDVIDLIFEALKKEKIMNKCVRIVFRIKGVALDACSFIQKEARKYSLEGMVQIEGDDGEGNLVACGHKQDVDDFVDILHKGTKGSSFEDIQIEPFLKDKDYRGVFRVIE